MLLIGTGLLWLLAAILPPRGRRAPETGGTVAFFKEFGEGVREARRHPWFLAGLGALTAVICTGYSATGVALPLIRRDRCGTEVVLAGALTVHNVGALAGTVLMAPDAPAHRARPRGRGWLACYGFAPLALLVPVHPAVVFAAYAIAGLGIDLFNVPGSPPRSARSSRACRPGCPRWTSWSPTVWPRSAWPFWPRRRDLRLATGAGRLRARVFRGSRRSRPDPHHSPLLPPPGHGRAETEPSKRWTGRAGPRNKIMMSAIWMVAR